MTDSLITIIMPVHNGSTTLPEVFSGLEKQGEKSLIKELIIIDDGSSDGSYKLATKYALESSFKLRIIKHERSIGLAHSYNEGIKLATTRLVITMHQDIVLTRTDSFGLISSPLRDSGVVVSFPILLHPFEVWKKYPFWQKCLFSRFVDKKVAIMTGKFDCYDKATLIKVGLFDADTFRTAGEDGDLKVRLKLTGKSVVNSRLEVVHLHSADAHFPLKKFIKKEAQLAEAQGVLLRKYGVEDLKSTMLIFFRQGLLLLLLVPGLNILALALVAYYLYGYTKLVYKHEYSNPSIIIVPFVNFYLLVVSLVCSVLGFIRGRQMI